MTSTPTPRRRSTDRDRFHVTSTAVYAIVVTIMYLTTLGFVLSLQQAFHNDCTRRQAYDSASQDTRRVFRDYYLKQQQQETHNPTIDDKLRIARVSGAQVLIDSLDTTLDKTVHSSCS